MSIYPHVYPVGAPVSDNNIDELEGVIIAQLPYIPRRGGAQYVVIWKDKLDQDGSYYIENEGDISSVK
jgi:hypothetical protein